MPAQGSVTKKDEGAAHSIQANGRRKADTPPIAGVDGTGELFADFVKLLPSWIEPRVVSYPRDRRLSYDQLLPILKSALPTG